MQKLGFARLLCLVGLLALVMLLHVEPAAAQEAAGPTDPAELEAFIDGIMAAQLADQHIAGATIAVVKDGEIFFAKGYGYTDIENHVPVDPEMTLFRIASVTKLFTWTAVMQLVEQGKLDLNEDVNTYLDFEIPDTYPGQPITLTHLLTHTPGFEDRGFRMDAASPEAVVPLGAWLADNIPARVRPPGTYSSYSNYGASLAGYIVERVSGMSYHDYVEQHILQPLDMTHTTSRQPLPDHLAADISGGYTYVNGAYNAEHAAWDNQAPAGSIYASATDMAHFMIAHLQDGRYGDVRILEEDTAQQMHSTLFTHDERLNGWAYGFEEKSLNGQRIIGHGGDVIPFHSMLTLLPEHNVGLFVSCNTTGCYMLRETLIDAFMDRYYPAPEPMPAEPPADFAERAGRFTGSYQQNRGSYTTLEKVIGLFGAFTVKDTDDGALLFISPLGEQRFVEVEPLVFYEVGGDDILIFQEDDQSRITHAFLTSDPILAYEKLAWYQTAAFHWGLLAVCAVLFLSFLIAAEASYSVSRRLGEVVPPLARVARWLVIAIALLTILFAAGFVVVYSDIPAFLRGEVSLLNALLVIPVLMAALTAGAVVFTVLAWMKGYWRLSGRIHYTLVTLAAVALIWSLNYWNLLGWRF